MPLGDDLRRERIRDLRARFLKASEAFPDVFHVAIRTTHDDFWVVLDHNKDPDYIAWPAKWKLALSGGEYEKREELAKNDAALRRWEFEESVWAKARCAVLQCRLTPILLRNQKLGDGIPGGFFG
jgi:hypothetical protein